MPLSSSVTNRPVSCNSVPEAALPSQLAVRALALEAGFTEAGMVGLPYADADRDAARFTEFIESGGAGSMQYLARRVDPEGNQAEGNQVEGKLVRSRVELPFPWARSAVVCAAGYNADAPLSTQPADAAAGWIARYAWSGRKEPNGGIRPSDYHKVLLKRLRKLEAAMHAAYGEFECRAYVDTGPVVERSLARAAGLGWTGKNTCLIHPKLGSWNFLAVLITSLPLAAEQAPLAVPDRCGSCRRCIDACPTEALTEPYRMDATRCISYLTIEHRGSIAEELMAGMGRQVFGCDICQDVCPWNRKAPIAIGEGSGRGNAEDDLTPRAELLNPALEWLAELDNAGFERLFNGSPIRRAGFFGLRRNIAIAMGNSGLKRFVPLLQRWVTEPDSQQSNPSGQNPVQEAALWALRRIAGRDAARHRGE